MVVILPQITTMNSAPANWLLPWLPVAAVAVAIACYEIARSGEEVWA